jgi:ribose transport system ATP-binding protein
MSLAVRNLTKRYAGVTVLDSVDLTVSPGEIHALLGANGAGKSTLIKCVSGAVAPDAGEIEIGGQSYASLTPSEALDAGLAVIYQELSVINTLNVVDNIFLGSELRRGPFRRRAAQRREAREWLERLGVDLDPDALLTRVGNAELQVVEIVKALRRRPSVLILDEPTAALTEAEVQRLGRHMERLKQEGLPLLFVTHRLAEVFDFADRVTVLRGGRVVVSGSVREFSRRALVEAIAGHAVGAGGSAGRQSQARSATPALSVQGLVGGGIGPVDLDVGAGEVIGIFGLVGSGRTELLETLFGARPASAGTIAVRGHRLKLRRPPDAVSAGVALVPSDRLRKGMFPTRRASENVLLRSFVQFSHFGLWRRPRKERSAFEETARQVKLDPPRPELEARRFSGGNQQKLVLGRWLRARDRCHVLLLDEPTQGVDVGARQELYEAIRSFSRGGCGVLLASSEPEELIEVADTVIVLSHGRLVGRLRGQEISETRMLALAHAIEEPPHRHGEASIAEPPDDDEDRHR